MHPRRCATGRIEGSVSEYLGQRPAPTAAGQPGSRHGAAVRDGEGHVAMGVPVWRRGDHRLADDDPVRLLWAPTSLAMRPPAARGDYEAHGLVIEEDEQPGPPLGPAPGPVPG